LTDLAKQIRDRIESQRRELLGSNPLTFEEVGVNRLAAALLAVLDMHQCVEGVGFTADDPDGYGTVKEACSGCGNVDEYAVAWPCRELRTIAKVLGIEANGV